MRIRALIVDDEPPARQRLRRLLEGDPDIELIGECDNGEAAVRAIASAQPDLVFLDVQMPELSGLEVVKRLGIERMPVTIFVTAYDRYAVGAFEAHALDYLLKPFSRDRFVAAITRAKRQISGSRQREVLRDALATLETESRYCDRLPVAQHGRIVFVSAAEVDWIEADGNYTRLFAGKDRHYEIRESLGSIERKLDPRFFVRIHRSTIVNIRSIKEIHRWFHGHHLVVLACGKELRMSRYQREALDRLGVR
ncbi:MAG TPA: LytTR family DNA-binding domain-containing protein [Steroidobacteraceae bacterium]|nr:LytTR family DNA-binding domain-containing protein [Steroidobacteraceae bacterium]